MQSYRYLCALFLGCAALTSALAQSPGESVKTWVVDNNPDNPAADFHGLQEALDAAAVGDRILVAPSLKAYDSSTISKSVTLIGPGFGSGNFNQGGAQKASISRITITAGSSDIILSGLRILNLSFSGRQSFGGPGTIKNVILYRNEFSPRNTWDNNKSLTVVSSAWSSFIENLYIINNSFFNVISFRGEGSDYWEVNAVISNNFIQGGIDSSVSNSRVRQNTFLIENNLIQSRTGDHVLIHNGVFRNNIVANETIEISSFENVSVESNVFIASGEEFINNNNIQVENLETLMVNEGEFGERWTLVEGSSAIGHGVGGVDAGIMGGRYPWGKSELSMLPYIKDLRAPAVVFQGDRATVEVEIGNPN